VRGALSTVRDPELDEPITDLGFVRSFQIEGDSVSVTLHLPTYHCAPNFAFIMASDAKEAVEAVPGVGSVQVNLVDNQLSDEINEGLAEGRGFDEVFPDDTAGTGLAGLRARFESKAFIARQEGIYRSFVQAGATPGDVTRLRLADLPDNSDVERYLDRRTRLGLDISPEAPFLVTAEGVPVSEAELDRFMLFARMVGVSIEGNASFCRGLLAARYGTPTQEVTA
ncbi:MAG: iron-sulfur cluster assembly protein, partial [Actinomycetota bacterium]